MAEDIRDYSRLCIHTITTKPLSLAEAIKNYSSAGIRGITVWRNAFDVVGIEEAARMLRDSNLDVVSLCRGGFFPALTETDRKRSIDENMLIIDEAKVIDAPLVVLVCGAVPGMPLKEARKQIEEGIINILPHAESTGVKLSIEPLHPMYADTRSAVNTIRQANEIVESINHPLLGVTVDVYHLWWDNALEDGIRRAGSKVFSFHVSDWRTPTRDILNDRALMGDGCINIRQIRGWVEETGFSGYHEVEIFSSEWWEKDQTEFIERIKQAYMTSC